MAFDGVGDGRRRDNGVGRSMDAAMDFGEEVARQRRRILRSTAAAAGD
jgi:hypothetical protein